MIRFSTIGKCAALSALCTPLAMSAAAADEAADPHAQHRQMMHDADHAMPVDKPAIDIPDVALTTQHGATVNLKSDVVGDRIVVMDFVYTTCTTVCPVLSAILSQVQQQLGERVGTEVVLASLTVDPQRDTPERLKAYADKFAAGEDWLWLTSDKQTMDGVLQQLGAYTPNFEDHPSMILVGDGLSGEYSRYVGFPGTQKILDRIDALSAARRAAPQL